MLSAAAAPRAVILGGFAAGTLDILDAMLFSYWLRGVSPVRVLQAVASGLVGRDAFDGGMATAHLGLGLHFLIALTVAAVYVHAARFWPALIHRPVAFGVAYGIAVYFFMRYLVLPLSAVGSLGFSWPAFINGILIHAFGVGLPIAVIARRSATAPARRVAPTSV
jgi:hypothetical protein